MYFQPPFARTPAGRTQDLDDALVPHTHTMEYRKLVLGTIGDKSSGSWANRPPTLLGEVTWIKDGHSKNLTRTRNVPPKCNKQVTSKQQTRSFLTSINLSTKTTVALGTATTILEIGISFPTLVDRRETALHDSIATEYHLEGHWDATKWAVIFTIETNSDISR
jgi:hypothetical protein